MVKLLKCLAVCLALAVLVSFSETPRVLASQDNKGPVKGQSGNQLKYAGDELIIKFKHGAPEIEKENIKKQIGLETARKLNLIGSELAKIKNGQKVEAVIERLKNNPHVLYAEPNYVIQADLSANDALFNSLWGLHNTGQPIYGVSGTADVDIDAPEAWNITLGSREVIVAVIDEGVDIKHIDLAPNIWANPGETPGDGVDNDGNGFIDDVNGWDFYHYDNTVFDPADGDDHGTHVAGTIAAAANNGTGVAGVAPNVKIMPIKFLGPGGGYTSDAIAALGYAKKMGARLSSNSWGSYYFSTSLRDAINAYGGVFVAAAGNNSYNTDATPHYPSAYDCPNIISVAAVNNQGSLAYFSNYGSLSVDVGAPGVDILSTIPGSYGYMSGTSMATPHVSGIVSLLLTVNPSLSPAQVGDIIKQTAVPMASLQGKTASGGMANAYAAVIAVKGQGPFVANTDPSNGASGVPLDKTISLQFNEDVVEGITFTNIALTASGGEQVQTGLNLSGSILTMDPAAPLEMNQVYNVTVPTGAVKNLSDNEISMAFTFNFSTPDSLAPRVVATDPPDGASRVPLDKVIAVQYNENIRPGNSYGSITVNQKPISGSDFYCSIAGRNFYIHYYGAATNNTLYTVHIPAGAMVDLAGNAQVEEYTFNFTTVPDEIAPEVYYSEPWDKETDVSISKVVRVHFSENLLEGSSFGNIYVTDGIAGVNILKSISNNILSITPVEKLSPNTAYTVTIPAGALTDLVGNGLATGLSFNFTTGTKDIFELPFPVEDAVIEPDPDKPILYLICMPEGKLYALNYLDRTMFDVKLGYLAQSLDIGRQAYSGELYVGLLADPAKDPYYGQGTASPSIAVIDRSSLTVSDTIPIEIDPFDLVSGRDGHIYVTSGTGQWTTMDSYSRANKGITGQTGIRHMSYAELHPNLERIYTIDTDLSPRDFTAYNISDGTFTDPTYPGGYDSPYHGDYSLYESFALDPTGKYIFNGSGNVFRTAADKTQDMRYVASLDTGFAGIAFEPDLSAFYTVGQDSSVRRYRGSDFAYLDSIKLGGMGNSIFKKDGKLIVLVQSATGSYTTGIEVFDAPAAPPLDKTEPLVTGTDPNAGATAVPVGVSVSITYDEDIYKGETFANISIADANNNLVSFGKVINGSTLTLDPSADLAYSTAYTVTIPAASVRDMAGNALSGNFTLSFNTGEAPDTTPPVALSCYPPDNTVGVPVDAVPSVTFSEDVQPGGSYGSTVLKDSSGATVTTACSLYRGTLTLTPAGSLDYSTTYTVTVPAGAVKDITGNALALEYNFSFSTEAEPDTVPPTVTGSNPAHGEEGVAVDCAIRVDFSEGVLRGREFSNITLVDSSNNPVASVKSLNGNVLTITPEGILSYSTTYMVSLPIASVADQAGNTLAQEYVFSFTTEIKPDSTPPEVIGSNPANNATGVPITAKPGVSFSEEVQPGSLYSSITLKDGSGATVATTNSLSGDRLTLSPRANLAYSTTYTVTVPAGAVMDMARINLAQEYTYSFRTEAQPDTENPVVTDTDPVDGAKEVAVEKIIKVIFSEDVVKGQDGLISLAGANRVEINESILGKVLTITPAGGLAPGTTYTVTIPKESIKDPADNYLSGDCIFSFNTTPDFLPPVVSITIPGDKEAGVDLDQTITVTFSENIKLGKTAGKITIKKGKASVSYNKNTSGNDLILDPVSNFSAGSTYTVTIPAGAVTDFHGKALGATYTFSFTTF